MRLAVRTSIFETVSVNNLVIFLFAFLYKYFFRNESSLKYILCIMFTSDFHWTPNNVSVKWIKVLEVIFSSLCLYNRNPKQSGSCNNNTRNIPFIFWKKKKSISNSSVSMLSNGKRNITFFFLRTQVTAVNKWRTFLMCFQDY